MPVAQPSDDLIERLSEAVTGGMPSAVADLTGLVKIPSVSFDGFDLAQVQASAERVKSLLEGLGVFETVEIARSKEQDSDSLGKPAVLARRAARNGSPTVLLYAHHDVQPPGADELWETNPFEPTLRGDRLYGRGAADDKAGVTAHVAAIRALTEVIGREFDLGLAVFIEGEEEHGSPSFSNFLADHEAELAADAIVVADSDNWDIETPSITVALRGNVTFYVTTTTLGHASHSGMWGGAVPDATLVMLKTLATLWDDETGAPAVPGLMARAGAVVPDFSEAQLREDAAILDGVRPIGHGPILDRIWNQPSITVTGMDLPSVLNGSNTLSPTVRAKVSVRVAPGQPAQEAWEAVRDHLASHAPFGATLEFDHVDTGEAFLVDTSAEYFQAAKDAMRLAWGRDAVEAAVGGSIPFIADLKRVFPDAQILVTGVEDPASQAHSPNESLHLGVFRRAILAEAILLAALNDAA